jgi:hypothetical protein
MATTTNYGWTTPDDTALVKDGASAIRSLGTSVDTTTKNLNPSTTLGDIEYRSSTANTNTRLAIGSTGNVLTVAGGVPTWAAPAGGGGKVLQVVNVNYSTELNSTSTSFIDTGLSASITPTSATSTILVMVSQNGVIKTNDMGGSLILLRGATKISDFAAFGYNNANNYSTATCHSLTYRDSPATTSSITYKTQSKVASGSGNYYLQFVAYSVVSVSSITLIEIGA